jgi:hypothetical protein
MVQSDDAEIEYGYFCHPPLHGLSNYGFKTLEECLEDLEKTLFGN